MRSIRDVLEGLLLGERRWGCVRFFFVLFWLFFFTYLGHLAFEESPISEIVQRWLDHYGILQLVPGSILRLLALFLWDFRFYLLSLTAFIAALIIGARYILDIYDIRKFRSAFSYLLRSLFAFQFPKIMLAFGYPLMQVDAGSIEADPDEDHLIRDIGGPGSIVVQPGSVVLFEHLDRPSKVCAEGTHFIARFETVRRLKTDETEIPTLNERHGYIQETRATTKDGIVIVIRDVNYRYRLRAGKEFGDYVQRDPENPNPYSVEAVYDMVYNRSVRLNREDMKTPEMNPWHFTINFAVDGAISSYIQERLFDDIVAPRFPNEPRKAVTDRIFSQSVRQRMRVNGAELLWWDIGHFAVQDNRVSRQLVETWGAKWEGESSLKLAYGNAERLKNLELGRAEVQAERLKAILKAFEKLSLTGDKRENIRGIILTHLAQILEGMTDQDYLPGGPNELPPPS